MSTFSLSVQLTSIILPKSLKIIGKRAFSYNYIEGTLVLPDSLQIISGSAFSSNAIENIVFSKNITTIGAGAFYGNQIQGTLIIPDSITSLEEKAFASNKISRVEFGNELTSIGSSAFASNQLTEGVKFSESINTIGNQAFYNIGLSGEIIIPASLEVIEGDEITYGLSGAFSDNQITKVSFEEGSKLKKIGRRAFSNNAITSVDFSTNSQIEVIDYAAFYGASITDLELPSSVTTIGKAAFKNIYTLTTLTFASNSKLETIGENAFNCDDSSDNTEAVITSITIPASVKNIEMYAFDRDNVQQIIFENTTERPSQLTTIGSGAFRGNEMTGELIIPASVKEI